MINKSNKAIFKTVILIVAFLAGYTAVRAQKDSSFYSQAFATERFYRIYLPSDYYLNSSKEYPVIYYFHGYGGRYKWDEYDITYDPGYPENGRTDLLYVKEWRDYAKTHNVIIVSWDGYEPNLHPGQKFREGIPYGWCLPYDFPRAHDKEIVQWGWDYRLYFRDLVSHIDSNYRTIADRDKRAITGLSMGGLTSLYISGQNKDLVTSVSAFCPADNIPKYGPKGYLSVFPVLEMYRSLKGLSFRLTANDGDWLYANDILMKRVFGGSGFKPFEYHEADFPDHGVADADLQLDFHMREFGKKHPKPVNWEHICPSFTNFKVWGYRVKLERPKPALTIMENMSSEHMKVYARVFIPDGPIVTNESVHISTDTVYTSTSVYDLVVYNLSSGGFSRHQLTSTPQGRLNIDLPGGGNIVGINGKNIPAKTGLRILNKQNVHYLYFEEGKPYDLNFDLVNVSTADLKNIVIRATSDHPFIKFNSNNCKLERIFSGEKQEPDNRINLILTAYDIENLVGNISLEVSVNGVVADTQKIVFYTIPKSPYVSKDDIIVLDGRTQNNVPVFDQDLNKIEHISLSGGSGNGNGIAEEGEEILVHLRSKQGLAPGDKNTFHKTYLIGVYENPYVSVNRLKYDEKIGQASSTSISSYVTVKNNISETDTLDLWFRLESLYNDENVLASRRSTYEFQYDYRRIKIPVSSK